MCPDILSGQSHYKGHWKGVYFCTNTKSVFVMTTEQPELVSKKGKRNREKKKPSETEREDNKERGKRNAFPVNQCPNRVSRYTPWREDTPLRKRKGSVNRFR